MEKWCLNNTLFTEIDLFGNHQPSETGLLTGRQEAGTTCRQPPSIVPYVVFLNVLTAVLAHFSTNGHTGSVSVFSTDMLSVVTVGG